VVFLLTWLVFIASIVVVATVVASFGGQQLLWPYVRGAGSISLANTAVGYLWGKALKAPPLGQVVLASWLVCMLLIVVWLLWVVLLLLGSGILLVLVVAGVGSSLASHGCTRSVVGSKPKWRRSGPSHVRMASGTLSKGFGTRNVHTPGLLSWHDGAV